MKKKIVVDTSTIIDHARGHGDLLKEILLKQQNGEVSLIIPTLVVFEFYSGLSMENLDVFEKAELLFSQFQVVPLISPIAKLGAELNRAERLYRRIGISDLLIAATSLYYQAELVTANYKDFRLVPGIKFYSSHKFKDKSSLQSTN